MYNAIEMHNKIKSMRLKHGFTLAYVADYLDITEATAQRYETGNGIKSIPYEVLEKYGELFNCNPSYFLGWDKSLDKNPIFDIELAPLMYLNLSRLEKQEIIRYAKYIVSQRG